MRGAEWNAARSSVSPNLHICLTNCGTASKTWKKLSTEQKRNWSVVFKENKEELILFTVVILALLLFGAWFEVWGLGVLR